MNRWTVCLLMHGTDQCARTRPSPFDLYAPSKPISDAADSWMWLTTPTLRIVQLSTRSRTLAMRSCMKRRPSLSLQLEVQDLPLVLLSSLASSFPCICSKRLPPERTPSSPLWTNLGASTDPKFNMATSRINTFNEFKKNHIALLNT